MQQFWFAHSYTESLKSVAALVPNPFKPPLCQEFQCDFSKQLVHASRLEKNILLVDTFS